VGALVVVAAIAGITIVVSSRRAPRPPDPRAPEPLHIGRASAAAEEAPASAQVRVPLAANVPCVVYNGEEEVGHSDQALALLRGQKITLTCRAEGYEEASRTFVPTDETPVTFRLHARARAHGRVGRAQKGESAPGTEEPTRETLPNPYHR
jgi:hypothetical protein